MTALMDPWSDAASIAARLSAQSARLVLIIGAESWCETCRTLRPVFESLAKQHENGNDIWIWLDLEDHAEFLDDLIPDSLPLMASYSGQKLTHAVVVRDMNESALTELLALPSRIEQGGIPDIRARLMTVDWAL